MGVFPQPLFAPVNRPDTFGLGDIGGNEIWSTHSFVVPAKKIVVFSNWKSHRLPGSPLPAPCPWETATKKKPRFATNLMNIQGRYSTSRRTNQLLSSLNTSQALAPVNIEILLFTCISYPSPHKTELCIIVLARLHHSVSPRAFQQLPSSKSGSRIWMRSFPLYSPCSGNKVPPDFHLLTNST